MSIDEAIQQFRGAAIEKGDFAEPAEKDHAQYDRMNDAWDRLEGHGDEGLLAFRKLLAEESRHVRLWVATQLLALGDESGLAVLEADVLKGGLLGFESETVLEEWREGRLRPPFGAVDA